MAGKKNRPIQLTFDDARRPIGRGGWRPGAGRKKGRRTTPHDARPDFAARYPLHVTMRIVPDLGSLRRSKLAAIVRAAISESTKPFFRVIEFSVQSNHVHMVVEAHGASGLSHGMTGLDTRIAKRLNRHLGRKGDVLADRYHARILRTPREVRNALRYVLLNARHHERDGGAMLGETWFDPFSSAAWFDGWLRPVPADTPWKRDLVAMPRPTPKPTVWLLTTGWKRRGLITIDELMR